ncbi:(1-_4)-alpha-D-glucan 1-alpha-D-glucosylmutase [Variovorax sp. HW608]|uniref:malto-oligosyltrehalose synthase n=1 Tax=Variovorax sp. HW608 TaxID=1034889 RepID=UPI00081FFE36|nr:malto-oligosyltrehalose synthase [Variovorax sp. HW608]SCK58404.1 (1->4)-alpha-D-glucan 1-alpha-D-glucosylmutase [Variovorax sp. HW608]
MTETGPLPPNEAEALLALCRRHGIATDYVDAFGHRHAVSHEALAALLADAGLVAHSGSAAASGGDRPFAAAQATAELDAWRHPLPTVQVVAPGAEAFEIDVRLPSQIAHFKWRVVDESGAFHEGAVRAERLDVIERASFEDEAYAHYRLPLTLALPEGYHQLSLVGFPGETLLVCAPVRCHQPGALASDARIWGFTLQLYGLRSRRNWGIGDFSDLADFAEHAAREGADVVGLSPLHALFPHNPLHASPYSPSSRAQLNVLYIDVEAVPDFRDCGPARERAQSQTFQARLSALRSATLIDYAGVAAAKHEVLRLLYAHFRGRKPADAESAAFARFREQGGEALHQHALFDALQAHFHAVDADIWGWPEWPPEYGDPSSPAVARFAIEHAEHVGYYEYLQWQAARQLETAGERAKAAGMGLGLYLDLAVSVDRAGSDAWRHRRTFALTARVGAPPDAFNPRGQDWGLPPLRPDRLRTSQYRIFIEALRANMRGAGAIRIDHVMMLMRLFWIPAQGTARDGTYVSYPVPELFAILALESQRHRCLVIGEDLGTVPEEMRNTLDRYGVLSYRLLYFERDAAGRFRAPADYPRQAVAAVSTHDLPPLAGWWSAHDLKERRALGLVDDAALERLREERRHDRQRLLDAVRADGHESLPDPGSAESPPGADDVAALHAFLARAPSSVMMVQLEDALAQVEQPNLPGTTVEHPNWRRKYALPVETLWDAETMRKLNAAMVRIRPQPDRSGVDRGRAPARVPRATYRLQLHGGFDFHDAARIVPYLASLGISHVYCSPIHRARPGSMHGYDVVAHDEINPELGGMPAFERFTQALRRHRMSQLIDLVPNHMGVLGTDNRWWMDVLEHGASSRYARHFDIDWHSPTPGLLGKVLVPVLGSPYGEVLERGELRLAWDAVDGAFGIRYYDHRFPLAPKSHAVIVERAVRLCREDTGETSLLNGIAWAFRELPCAPPAARDGWDERERHRQRLKSELAALAAGRPAIAEAIAAAVDELNAPGQRDALHGLIDAQSYRLAYWRTAADEINYRRFFDVNELAALRTEREAVFEATHALALDLAARGWVEGLRIDHPDGLLDPAQYFQRLQDGFALRCGEPMGLAGADGRPLRPLYVVAEKIAAPHEEVPESWAIHGTTGYRFANVANAVLVERGSARRLDRIWRAFTGTRERFDEVVRQAKHEVVRGALASDLEVLALTLLRIAKSSRRSCDYTLNTLREIIATVAASLTVYRTYNADVSTAQDRHFVDQAVELAREKLQLPEDSVFGFVRNALLGHAPEGADAAVSRMAVRFARRFQQFSAPAAAKGMEDTAFYRYFPLCSLAEVGGEPDRIGMSLAEFHEASADRQRRWPHTMLATSTHDNKRSEDVRLRIDVLSECPGLWRLALGRWHAMNAPHRGAVSAMHEYLLYQTLLGTMDPSTQDADARAAYIDRIERYMLKAAREGKRGTSWTHPDPAYEESLARFVYGVLASDPGNRFLGELRRAAGALDRYGALNGISLALIKFCSPGVPDIYQGCELIDRSLVDPDNRRAVDYAQRERRLQELQSLASGPEPELAPAVRALVDTATDGRAKLWLTWRLLALRAREAEFFREGSYEPLEVQGPRARHLVAFMRRHRGRVLIALAVRFFATLDGPAVWRTTGASSGWSGQAWEGAELLLPPGTGVLEFEDCITGIRHYASSERLSVAQLLRAFPGAALVGGESAGA